MRAGAGPVRRYRSAGARANWVLLTLGGFGILSLLSLSFTILELDLLMRIESGGFVSEEALAGSDSRQLLVAVLSFPALIATAISFCFWIHRASANLEPLGAEGQRFSPGWAVGFWFVPIAWLILPYLVMKEIWKGSSPRRAVGAGASWKDAPASPLLGCWWVAWLSGNVTAAVGLQMFENADTIRASIRADWVYIAGEALLLASGILAFALVWQITSNQENRNLSQGQDAYRWGP